MSVEFAAITGLVSMALGILGFYSGRVTAAKKDAHEDAAVLTSIKKDIEYIQKDLSGILNAIERNEGNHNASIRRLHDRISEHEQKYHNVNAPPFGVM